MGVRRFLWLPPRRLAAHQWTGSSKSVVRHIQRETTCTPNHVTAESAGEFGEYTMVCSRSKSRFVARTQKVRRATPTLGW